jgi:putative hydroxymethylpyrimidine transport system permease protein
MTLRFDDNGSLAWIKSIVLIAAVVIIVWHVLVVITGVPAFVFPPPTAVALTLVNKAVYLLEHSMSTTVEIVCGLLIGSALGVLSALLLVSYERSRRWAMPLMVMTQSLPVFALAPLLTLWFGYGMSSKIIMAVLIIYFPVVAASFDGLRHTPNEMLNLARSMRASKWAIIWHIRLPAAMPSMASGVRVATSVAPIGAVVGEWVGSSHGLGYVMLNANGRMQTDLMFAALLCLCVIAALLYGLVNRLLDRCLYWQKDSAISV